MDAGQDTAPRRKTDEEIRARIAEHEAGVSEAEERDSKGSEGWLLLKTAISELRWVLGE